MSQKHKYKRGDRVVIISPPPQGKDRNAGPGWAPSMDQWAGSTAIVRECEHNRHWLSYLLKPEDGEGDCGGFSWDESWLLPEQNGASLYAWDKEEEELARLKGKRDEQLRQMFEY